MTADRIRLRPATAADAALVGRLLNDFNTEFGEPTPTADEFAGRFAGLLGGDTLAVVLAEDGANTPNALAFALVTFRSTPYWDGPVALLEELYVHPAWRGQGIGTRLMDDVEDLARTRGSQELQIHVHGADTDARRFYERRGYDTVEPGEPSGEPTYYFDKTLA